MIVAQLVERLLPNSYILEGCGSNLVIGSLKHNSIAKMRQIINSKRVLMVLSAKYFPNVQNTFCPIEFPITQRIKIPAKTGKQNNTLEFCQILFPIKLLFMMFTVIVMMVVVMMVLLHLLFMFYQQQ